MSTAKKSRENTRTSLSLAPLSVEEALEALLRTPPPKPGTPEAIARVSELKERLARVPKPGRTKKAGKKR